MSEPLRHEVAQTGRAIYLMTSSNLKPGID